MKCFTMELTVSLLMISFIIFLEQLLFAIISLIVRHALIRGRCELRLSLGRLEIGRRRTIIAREHLQVTLVCRRDTFMPYWRKNMG